MVIVVMFVVLMVFVVEVGIIDFEVVVG